MEDIKNQYLSLNNVDKNQIKSYYKDIDKQFTAIYTPEAEQDLKNLDKQNIKRVLRSVGTFEQLGKDGVKSRPLNNQGLFEIKCDKVRIYFMYHEDKIIIIGLIVLKKTQKAPERYITVAMSNIEKYIKEIDNDKQ